VFRLLNGRMPFYKRTCSPRQLQFITTSTCRRASLFLGGLAVVELEVLLRCLHTVDGPNVVSAYMPEGGTPAPASCLAEATRK